MATENLGKRVSFIAGADLSAKQYYPMALSADNTVVVAGDTDVVIGILQNNPIAGQAAEVCVNGISKIKSYATLTFGLKVMPSANGAIVATGSGKTVFGIVTESADSGEIGSVLIVSAGVALA